MTHIPNRPVKLLTLLQALTFVIVACGTWLAWLLCSLGLIVAGEDFFKAEVPVGSKIFLLGALATVVIVSVCCYITLGSFFVLLQRMKEETAFTRRNCRALGRMARSCAIAAAALFLIMSYIAVSSFVPSFRSGLWAFLEMGGVLMMWPFSFGVVALLIQGVRLLMERALALQEEQSLVI